MPCSLPLRLLTGTAASFIAASVLVGCSTKSSSERLAEDLARVVAESAAKGMYPQRVTDEQEITGVTADGTTITFRNRFVRLSAADIDLNSITGFRANLRSQVCSTSEFVKAGATQKYTYYDRDGVYLTMLSFSSADCA